jgi:hypothetical protein
MAVSQKKLEYWSDEVKKLVEEKQAELIKKIGFSPSDFNRNGFRSGNSELGARVCEIMGLSVEYNEAKRLEDQIEALQQVHHDLVGSIDRAITGTNDRMPRGFRSVKDVVYFAVSALNSGGTPVFLRLLALANPKAAEEYTKLGESVSAIQRKIVWANTEGELKEVLSQLLGELGIDPTN